jgi:hypothetical protein
MAGSSTEIRRGEIKIGRHLGYRYVSRLCVLRDMSYKQPAITMTDAPAPLQTQCQLGSLERKEGEEPFNL